MIVIVCTRNFKINDPVWACRRRGQEIRMPGVVGKDKMKKMVRTFFKGHKTK